MIDINSWLKEFTKRLLAQFGDRILFIGLQGSYGRGEAAPASDLDVVVIFDRLELSDMRRYDSLLAGLPCRELVCGFISGKDELKNWVLSDLFQFYFDTEPVYGSLKELLPPIGKREAEAAVRMGACNLYHGCVHNFLHDKDQNLLKALYKSAVFSVQAAYYAKTGVYIKKHAELLEKTENLEKEIMKAAVRCKSPEPLTGQEFSEFSDLLLRWTKSCLAGIGGELCGQ